MNWKGKSNLERFLEWSSPRVCVHYYTQTIESSSSSVATDAKPEEEVRRPRTGLKDVWSAYDEWSAFGIGVPLSLEKIDFETTTQHYNPTLSAMQIFTIKPFVDDSSASRSSTIGIYGTETGSAKPNSYGKYKYRVLSADQLGHLYLQYNETKIPYERAPLSVKITELAEQHKGLYSLTSTDLSPYSWISVAWYPSYPIPAVRSRKEVFATFLTYHSLKPHFPETAGQDDKGSEPGVSSTREVVLPSFGVVTYKAFGDAWFMPGTLDKQNMERLEESASSWLTTIGFNHSDFNFFMSNKFFGGP